ncbi:MAG TPA: hypothetical protein PLV92_03325 [Pirellulaceae bacterium]|nr:hypothetical protein [Pirellulaceae bacterium]
MSLAPETKRAEARRRAVNARRATNFRDVKVNQIRNEKRGWTGGFGH